MQNDFNRDRMETCRHYYSKISARNQWLAEQIAKSRLQGTPATRAPAIDGNGAISQMYPGEQDVWRRSRPRKGDFYIPGAEVLARRARQRNMSESLIFVRGLS